MPKDIDSIQIIIDEAMEKLLVETVIDNFKDLEDKRNKKDYGMDSKGLGYTFDSKKKALDNLYYGKREVKNIPWKFCSNRSLKIAMSIIDLLHSRMFPIVWNEDLIKWKPTEKTDKEKVERINKLMDWWIRARSRMKGFFDGWCKVAVGYGDVASEITWDIKYIDIGEVLETPIIDEFGIQLREKDGTPSVSKEKKLRIEENTKTEIIPRENIFLGRDIQEDPVIIKCNWIYSDLEQMEQEGKAVNVSIPTFETSNYLKTKIENVINETYSSSTAENIETIKEIKLRSTPIDVLKCYIKIDIDRDGFAEDVRILIDPLRKVFLGGVAVKDISKRGKRPIDFTKINDLIEDPTALEGYGYLEIVAPLAEEIDAIFNQLTDANTLSILKPGFYDPSGNLVPQNITIAPNKLIPVSNPQRNIYYPDFQIPTERLIVAIRTVMEFIERLTAASSYVLGRESEIVGGSGTATRTQAIVGAAEQRFAIPAEKLREGAGRILTLILDQVQKNIPPGLENRILGEDDQPIFNSNELTDDGISGEYDAYLLEDASMGSDNTQRQLISNLYALLMQNPLVATNATNLYSITAELIKAHKENPVDYIGPEPEPLTLMTPEEENTRIVQGDFKHVNVKMTENHLQHLTSHQAFIQSPTMQVIAINNTNMIQQLIAFIQQHIQQHMVMMQQMMATMTKFGGQGGQPGQGGSGQATTGQPGMGNIAEPAGSVAARQETGASGFTPSM
jgi:hypothetical protein